jgi:type IV secretory pathway VirB10-like protein
MSSNVSSAQMPAASPAGKRFWTKKKIAFAAVGGFILLIGITSAANSGNKAANISTDNTSATKAAAPAQAAKPAAKPAAPAAPAQPAAKPAAPAAPAGPTLTSQQQNAAESAQNYLTMEGFSRQGLIDQLSSSAGDGYSVQDATVAVDSLNVDWNAQAVRSAKSYLSMEAFSCNGLIQQLDSSAGDKYTVAQATYGAKQAGAC